MPRTTLRRLEVFVAVVDAGGFRACSDRLDISPADVSHQVNQLEEEIGYRLFIRRRGRMCGLTEQGAKAYSEAKDLLRHAGALEGMLHEMKGASTLVVDSELTLQVRRAMRGDLVLDRTAQAFTRQLGRTAPGVQSLDIHRAMKSRSSAPPGKLD